MTCKLCGQPIQHTFATLFLMKHMHVSCELTLKTNGNVMTFPFLKGLIHIDYLLERYCKIDDYGYIEKRYLSPVIKRAIQQKEIILWQDDLLDNDVLYLLFMLGEEGVYWIFLQNPNWID